eukprot:6210406-Pleurochrysis_carterae.AAC.2
MSGSELSVVVTSVAAAHTLQKWSHARSRVGASACSASSVRTTGTTVPSSGVARSTSGVTSSAMRSRTSERQPKAQTHAAARARIRRSWRRNHARSRQQKKSNSAAAASACSKARGCAAMRAAAIDANSLRCAA